MLQGSFIMQCTLKNGTLESSSEELGCTKNGIMGKACCCINICAVEFRITPAKPRKEVSFSFYFYNLYFWEVNVLDSILTYDRFSHCRTLLQGKPMQAKMSHSGLPGEQA
jgi:hypothetical protein